MESYQFESDPTGSSKKFCIREILNLLTDADSSTNTVIFSVKIFFVEVVKKKLVKGVQNFFYFFLLRSNIFLEAV